MNQTDDAPHTAPTLPSPASGGRSGRGRGKSQALITPSWYAEMTARLRRIADGLLRQHEERLRPPLELLDNPSGAALLRETSDILALWSVCGNSPCRRARECRRDFGRCVARFAPLMPPGARAHVIAELRERHQFRSFPRKRVAG